MRSTYFDTSDHDLKAAGFSLRVRAADGGYVQTLKQKHLAGGVSRSEWEAPVPNEALDLSLLADTPAAALIQRHRQALTPVFTTTVQRTCHFWAEGQTLVEACLDLGELAAGGFHEEISEIELELKAGEPQALFALARQLASQSPMQLMFDSKSSRGYRLSRQSAVSTVSRIGCVKPGRDVAGALRDILWDCLIQISENAARIDDVQAVEAVHQVRIGLRRLDTALRLFRPVLADEQLNELSVGADWLAGELALARNLDVFRDEVFGPAQVSHGETPGYAALGLALGKAHRQAYLRVEAAVRSARFSTWLVDAAALIETGRWAAPDHEGLRQKLSEDVTVFAADRLGRLHHRVIRQGATLGELDAQARHRLRIKAKRLRYGAEFFANSFGTSAAGRSERFIRAVRRIQSTLGQANDLHTARCLAEELAGEMAPDAAFMAGLIVGTGQCEGGLLDHASLKAMKGFARLKPFWMSR